MMGMEKGDVLGHEPMGIVVEVGSAVRKLKKGDRVVVPFVIACGHCFFVASSSIPAATRRILKLKKRAS
jgi:threonine dehydrogenase-like Zn-dependent dehydrogenase